MTDAAFVMRSDAFLDYTFKHGELHIVRVNIGGKVKSFRRLQASQAFRTARGALIAHRRTVEAGQ